MPPNTAEAAEALSSVRLEKLICHSLGFIVLARPLYGADAAGSSAISRAAYCSVRARRQYPSVERPTNGGGAPRGPGLADMSAAWRCDQIGDDEILMQFVVNYPQHVDIYMNKYIP
jgi:hypothetical protein